MTVPTHVAQLTPVGRGAVATVAVEGPDAVNAVRQCLRRKSGATYGDLPIRRICVGVWHVPAEVANREAAGEELVVCRVSQERVEVHCHGGQAAVEAVIGSLESLGCRRCTWPEWMQNSTGLPGRTEIASALAEARTQRVAAILLDQLQGAQLRTLRIVQQNLDDGATEAALQELEQLRQSADVGLHLIDPWQVALVGRPNVGKSSLINAMLGFERAIVFDQPGTTRDLVVATTAIDGWPVQFADTAGIRDQADELEAAGIERAEAHLRQCDLVLLIDDVESTEHDRFPAIPEGLPCLKVINKVDLNAPPPHALFDIATSVVTGEGIELLLSRVISTLVPSPPPEGAAVLFDRRQIAAIDALISSVQNESLPLAVQQCRRLVEEQALLVEASQNCEV